jgi:hypothetical protein
MTGRRTGWTEAVGDELLGETSVIVIGVESMTARREYHENRTVYWTWEREA